MNNILDETDSFDTNLLSKPTIINWTSIIFLWAGIAFCLLNGMIGNVKVISAIVLLFFSTLITYFKYSVGVKITFGTILIGMCNLVTFFPISFSMSFGIGNLGLGFEFILLAILIIHFFTNRETLGKAFFNAESEGELESGERNRIDTYKNRFTNKSLQELKTISNNKDLLPEANKAAKELIDEKEDKF